MKFSHILSFTLLLAVNSYASVEYGFIAEDNQIIATEDNFYSNDSEIRLSLNGLKVDLEQNYSPQLPSQTSKLTTSTNNYTSKNDDLIEFIGMFIRDYSSSKNIKLKLKFTRDAELTHGIINYKMHF